MPDVKEIQTAPVQEAAVPAETAPSAPSRPPVKKPAGKGRQKIVKRLIALGVAAAIFGGGGFALYRFLTATDDEVGEIFPATASIGTIQSKVSGQGTARAKEQAAITLTQSGVVQEVYVTGGQTVMAGDPLYTIYSEAAEKALTEAQTEMDKLLEEANNLTVQAPFAGKLMDVSEFQMDQEVSKGTKIATLVNDKKLKLSLYFSYAYEGDIHVGQSVDVSIPAVMKTYTGRVEKINKVSFVSPEGAVHFEVVIVFDDPGTLTEKMDASAMLTDSEGGEIYPYRNGQTQFYETRDVLAKASGPVIGLGNLLNYANVYEGEPLLYLGSNTIDEQIRNQQTKLDEAQNAMNDFNAVAPIDGTVTSCNLVEGQEVKSGDTVVMISNNVTMLVTITVDDRNIAFIKPGSFVDLSDWNGNVFQGQVTSIDMAGAESGQGMTNYPVTLEVDNFGGALMDGAYLQYSFVTSESEACVMVPTACVQYFSDTEGNRCSVVFVQMDQPPEELPELEYPTFEPGQKRTFPSQEEGYYPVVVETGIADTQNVEIISGVNEGDTVFYNYTVTDYSGW
ncbi:MAG: HlyD family efflux transporter periplasmic adaptor subunit [Lawsonibacter sp.]|jgi:HlyD family secretion protein|nr:HlyD family efflux transporter periplasmic adaptor subunit [Lawsonibacter sp.]MCI8989673.1 HlyD family efflux transporter periplasmic adaptor subunit [Lawsonibacter sp.]MCI9267834.1 HlyD family efflux transporter periplasmic adaptor subunit [Lawsonibacter sp.]